MEQAVAEPAVATPPTPGALPHVPLSRTLQTARFLARPIPFYETWRGRLGETFRARLLGPGDVVFLSDPDSIKRLFTSDRDQHHRPRTQHRPAAAARQRSRCCFRKIRSTCDGAS